MTYNEMIEAIKGFNNDGYIISEKVANKYHLSTEHITDEMNFDGMIQELRELEKDIYEISIYKIFEIGGKEKTRITATTKENIFVYYLDGKFYSGGEEINEVERLQYPDDIIQGIGIETIETFIK